MINLVEKNGITQEVKNAFAFMMGDDWVETVEIGSKDEFESELAKGIDSLTMKVMGISGQNFVDTMSFEMGQWIKDTTLLWVKNKGAGEKTNEDEVNRQKE
jgi:hypothetical protein